MKEDEARDLGVGGTSRRLRSLRRSRRARRTRRVAPSGTVMLERFLKENASGLTFLGVTLGMFVSRKFFIVPVAIGLMLAQEKLASAGLERAARAVRR